MDRQSTRWYEVIVNERLFTVSARSPWIAADKAVKGYCDTHPMAAARKRKSGYSLSIQLRRVG